MKKRFALVLFLIVILNMSIIVSAEDFEDVPSEHWAYNAINKLASVGWLDGYPDNSFQGDNEMTRYEIAVLTARILDKVQALATEIEATQTGLTIEQGRDVEAIINFLTEKNLEINHISDEEFEEIKLTLLLLVDEYGTELELLKADTSEVNEEMALIKEHIFLMGLSMEDLNSRLYEVENPRFEVLLPEYDFEMRLVNKRGTGTPYVNPFDKKNGQAEIQEIDLNEYFRQKLSLGAKIDEYNVDFELETKGTQATPEDVLAIDKLTAKVKGADFKASISDEQTPEIAEFLFAGAEDDTVNGLVLEKGTNKYVLGFTEKDSANIEDSRVLFAGENKTSLYGNNVSLIYGVQDVLTNNAKGLLGANTAFNVNAFEITPTYAFNIKEPSQSLFNVKALGEVANIKTLFEYRDDNGLSPLKAVDYYEKVNGYKLQGAVDFLNLTALHENYHELPVIELSADKEFSLLDAKVDTDFGYRRFTDNEASRIFVKTKISKDFFHEYFEVVGALKYIDLQGDYFTNQLQYDSDFDEDSTVDKTLKLTYYGISDFIDVGVEKFVNDNSNTTTVMAKVNPDKQSIVFVDLLVTPYLKTAYELSEEALNYTAGIKLERAVTNKTNFFAQYEIAEREFNADILGLRTLKSIGFEYDVSKNINASLNYKDFDFEDSNSFVDDNSNGNFDDSYRVTELTGGLSIAF
ncbi:MAG: S-layer homology domain-containing protein [bacterium]